MQYGSRIGCRGIIERRRASRCHRSKPREFETFFMAARLALGKGPDLKR